MLIFKSSKSGRVINTIIFFIVIIMMMNAHSCRNGVITPQNPGLNIFHEYNTGTSIWLKLKKQNAGADFNNLDIYRDNKIIMNLTFFSTDTIVKDNPLNPDSDYEYFAILSNNQNKQIKSNIIQASTGDTSSIDYSWERYNIGDFGSTVNDVSILSENNIWAVGYTDDFNAFHWDGSNWEYLHIPVKLWNSDSYINANLTAVIALNEDDIWVSSGAEVIHYDGTNWGNWTFLFESMSDTAFRSLHQFWAASSAKIWAIGFENTIFSYDGLSWKRKTVSYGDYYDIDGYYNFDTEELSIWVSGFNVLLHSTDGETWTNKLDLLKQQLPSEKYVYVRSMSVYDNENMIVSIWNGRKTIFYRVDQMELKNLIKLGEFSELTRDMSGDFINDIAITGYHHTAYYNGNTINLLNKPGTLGQFLIRIDNKDNILCTAGWNGSSGVIIKGTK